MRLITHDRRFHLDEVMATAVLKIIYPSATVERTRDPNIIKDGTIVYDVGGVYDPVTLRFDHHQRGFDDRILNVKLSSAGLVYRHFHPDLFKVFGFEDDNRFFRLIYYEVYDEYFKYADAIDNGVDVETFIRVPSEDSIESYKDSIESHKDSIKNLEGCIENLEDITSSNNDLKKENESREFILKTLSISTDNVSQCRNRSLANMVSDFNNTENGFESAVNLVKDDLERYLTRKLGTWAVELEMADELLRAHMATHQKGTLLSQIIVLQESDHCSMDVLFIMAEYYKYEICYVIYCSEKDHRIYAMKASRFSFATKVPLKKEWRGHRGEELQKISQVEDATFVHSSGFTGGALSLKGAVKMCEMSLMEKK